MSKRGFGVSAGVKGARISVGPRGVNAYGGLGPFRYQQRLDTKQRSVAAVSESGTEPNNPLSLKRPTNWHAWAAFIFIGVVAGPIKELPSWLHGIISTVLLFGWCYTLFRGPKPLQAYRSFLNTDLSQVSPQERVNFLNAVYSDYPELRVRIELAQAYYDSKMYAEALPHFESLVSVFNLPALHAGLGICYKSLGKFDTALDCFKHCDEEDEFNQFLLILKEKAECYIQKRAFDLAIETVDQGLRKRGEQHAEHKRELRLLKAKILLETGDEKKAAKELEKLVAEVPDHEDAQALLDKLKAS